jgi:hypothetical protein
LNAEIPGARFVLRIAERTMTRLILTSDASTMRSFVREGRADIAVDLMRRFVWGPLPSGEELETRLAARTTQEPAGHWLDYALTPKVEEIGWNDLGLIEVCRRCETVDYGSTRIRMLNWNWFGCSIISDRIRRS